MSLFYSRMTLRASRMTLGGSSMTLSGAGSRSPTCFDDSLSLTHDSLNLIAESFTLSRKPESLIADPADPGGPAATQDTDMPHVIVKLWPGKTDAQKAQLADAIARDVIAHLGSSEASVSV